MKQLGERLERKPTPQDVLLYGLLEPRNLLDIVRNFVVFEVEGGRSVRKLTRYKQFIAVNEAMGRIQTARKPGERGDFVWHTQGSGKSLTMLWLALKLRRDAAQPATHYCDRHRPHPSLIGRLRACSLRAVSRIPSGQTACAICGESWNIRPAGTVMTTIQKFQEITDTDQRGCGPPDTVRGHQHLRHGG